MIAAIHNARRKKREAAAAHKAQHRTAENSMDSLEDSTHETDAGERAQAGSTKLAWTDVVKSFADDSGVGIAGFLSF